MSDAKEAVVTDKHGGKTAARDRSPMSLLPVEKDDVKSIHEQRGNTSNSRSWPEGSETSSTTPVGPIPEEQRPPPLPPRPTANPGLFQDGIYKLGSSLRIPKRSARPSLQSTATTALSRTDIHTQSYQDGSRETTASARQITPASKAVGSYGSIRRFKGFGGPEGSDSASVRSYAPTLETGGDVESLLGEVLGASQESPAWKLISAHLEAPDPFESTLFEDDQITADFYREFDEIREVDSSDDNEGSVHALYFL